MTKTTSEIQDERITDEILDYYAVGKEEQRLQHGIGLLEYARTRELLLRCLPPPPAVVYDIGGGTGAYALWLARLGYTVHLLELSPHNVEKARKGSAAQPEHPLAAAAVADARQIDRPDTSADAVLLMGPLYHLCERKDRLQALDEARRLLKPGGLLVAAAISRFGSLLYGMSTYGQSTWLLEEPEFTAMVARELADGQHIRPEGYPLFTRAFFHLPGELRAELEEAGFAEVDLLAVEGPGWIAPNFEQLWAEESHHEPVFKMVRQVEREESLLGLSPHLLGIGRKNRREDQ